jgi:hypothetical protein
MTLIITGSLDSRNSAYFCSQVRRVHSAYFRAAGSVFARNPASTGAFERPEAPSRTSFSRFAAGEAAWTTLHELKSPIAGWNSCKPKAKAGLFLISSLAWLCLPNIRNSRVHLNEVVLVFNIDINAKNSFVTVSVLRKSVNRHPKFFPANYQ